MLLAQAGSQESVHHAACGTPLASEVGAEPLKGKRDFEKAKQLIKEAGLYKSERK